MLAWCGGAYMPRHETPLLLLVWPSLSAAERAVLRATLREEARKTVGDTGLLDHLLKHLVSCASWGRLVSSFRSIARVRERHA